MTTLILGMALCQATTDRAPMTMQTDLGYRFLAGERGNFNTYRSVVNLNDGPRVLGFQTTMPGLRLTGANWGDPFNTLMGSSEKKDLFRLSFQYRNLAYFDSLPSFANTQLGRNAGITPDSYTVNQRALDTRMRFWNVDLDLLPSGRWRPFFNFGGQSGRGTGVSPLVFDENSYPAATRIDFGTLNGAGGLRYEGEKTHLTFEQGGLVFNDDQTLALNGRNLGNRLGNYLGQTLRLDQGAQAYTTNGRSVYTSALGTVSPVSWLDFTGQFYYSRPKTETTFNENAAGNLIFLDTLRFVNGQQTLTGGVAALPRRSGFASVEARPFSRLRIIDSWQADRVENSAVLSGLTTLTPGGGRPPANLTDRLVWNQSEHRVQGFVDVLKSLTLSAGHRYLWGDAQVRRGVLSTGGPQESGGLKRHSALAGLAWRPVRKFAFNADAEVGRGSETYFRTSLQNFEQTRLRARYEVTDKLRLQARFQRLTNANPTAGVNLQFRSQLSGSSVEWVQKSWSLLGDYTRATVFNDLTFPMPTFLTTWRSLYRDNAHTVTALSTINLKGDRAALILGGSIFRSAGSRPTRFYQPMVKLQVSPHKRARFFGEWRQASLGQSIYSYEAFGANLITVGVSLLR